MNAQVVKDPLLAYYKSFDNSSQLSPKTKIYRFEADFTGNGHKSVFITNALARLGRHGNYDWSVYYPLDSGGYQVVSDSSHFIDMWPKGPDYIGYIDQIKRYGIVVGFRDGVNAQYLDNGVIKSTKLRGHSDAEHYPKYFPAQFPDYHITTYTLAQLAQKYAGQ